LYRAGRQNEALECYRLVSGVLAEELGVDPGGELRQLHQQVLTGDAVLDSYDKRQTEELVPGNLPVELARFVGREEPLALAVQLLDSSRLVTLTGLAGIGKSRLALEVAAQRQSCFPDGVWVVDLAPVSAPELVGEAMAEVVGAEAATCVERLKEKRALLVLDNCEHLVDGVAAAVTTLLRAAPDVRVLVTSRQRLGVLGEHVFRVPPLTDDEAVDLLVDRATAFASDFRADNPATLARLCRRLDGMALAVELAAARLSALSLEEVVERLDDRFRLLTDTGVRITRPSHRTLSRAIGSSYELCSEREKLLWARLSVFGCEFDLASAETVGAGTGIEREDVVDLLSCLVHKSILVATVSGDKARYHLAEAVRLYGQERLYELGQEVEVRRRLHERVNRSDQKAS
jgi:predicted ATPase